MRGSSRFWPVAAGLLVLGSVSWSLANQTGPLPGHTAAPEVGGVPAERTCGTLRGCHLGNPIDNGQGSATLVGLPVQYEPGTTYELELHLESTSTAPFTNRRWGFQITAIRLDTGIRAGTWTASRPDQLLRSSTAPLRDYLSHALAGTRQGASSPVVFPLTWTAPNPATGPIGFFFCGNAADGDGTNDGDFIYTGWETSAPKDVAVEAATWGALKRLGPRP